MRVLIVEDDDAVRDGLCTVLTRRSNECTTATRLEDARRIVDDASVAIDIVLLDIWLDDDDGVKLLADVRRSRPGVPVVVMSGGGPGRSLEQALATADALGATETLIKPFTNDELFRAIARARGTD